MHKTLMKRGVALTIAAVLAGCAVGPNYKRPETPVAPKFAGAEASTYSTDQEAALAQFWTQFNDATLNQLVSDSLLANHDLRIALGHLVEARAARRESMFDLAPTVTAQGGHTNELVPKVQAGFPFTVEVGAFEDAVLEPESVDVVASSSAFHWLDTRRALTQVARVLRSGGAVALLWTSAGRELEDPALGPALDAVYREHAPELAVDAVALARRAIDGVGGALTGDTRFEGCVERRFVEPLRFGAEAFVELLGTYSDHAVLPAQVRAGLFGAVRLLIEERFGGALVRHVETRMFCARRR